MSSVGTEDGVQRLIGNYHKHIDVEKVIFDFAVFDDKMTEILLMDIMGCF